jgi:hypothetical protein
VVRIERECLLPVDARVGFDYITDPANWPEYWPRLVRVVSAPRWREPGDRARVVLRMLGRELALDMTLVRIEPYVLVEYTSVQRGLPTARHRRSFRPAGDELAYGLVVEYEPRPSWRGLLDRLVVRRAIARAQRETVANLDRRFRGG